MENDETPHVGPAVQNSIIYLLICELSYIKTYEIISLTLAIFFLCFTGLLD